MFDVKFFCHESQKVFSSLTYCLFIQTKNKNKWNIEQRIADKDLKTDNESFFTIQHKCDNFHESTYDQAKSE